MIELDYYSRKAAFHREIKNIVNNDLNFNKKFSISSLEIEYSGKYGFSRSTIIKAFQPFEKIGRVEITEHHIIFHGKKIPETKLKEDTTDKTAVA